MASTACLACKRMMSFVGKVTSLKCLHQICQITLSPDSPHGCRRHFGAGSVVRQLHQEITLNIYKGWNLTYTPPLNEMFDFQNTRLPVLAWWIRTSKRAHFIILANFVELFWTKCICDVFCCCFVVAILGYWTPGQPGSNKKEWSMSKGKRAQTFNILDQIWTKSDASICWQPLSSWYSNWSALANICQ